MYKKLIGVFVILLLIFFIYIKFFSSQNIRNKIASLLIFKRLDKIENELHETRKNLENLKQILQTLEDGLLFDKKTFETVEFGNLVKKSFLIDDKFPEQFKTYTSRWNFIEQLENRVIITYHHGKNYFFDVKDLEDEKLNLIKINSNLEAFISNKYENALIGVRDTFIHSDGWFYVSLLKEFQEDCNGFIIVRSKINFEKMNFELFYEQPNDCDSRSYLDGNDWHAGGAIGANWNNELILSIGDFSTLKDAQENKNLLGKVIEISKSNKNTSSIALGLRNPSSLILYKADIFITDIGPKSGDEINHINKNDKLPVNFGWPYSTYGEHDFEVDFSYSKSHKDKGYKEPLAYGTQNLSFTPSNIIFFESKKTQSEYLMLSTLKERGLFLFKVNRDENKKLINIEFLEKILFKNRIRDMKLVENKLFLIMEDPVELSVINFSQN